MAQEQRSRAAFVKFSDKILDKILVHKRQENRKSKRQPNLVEGVVMRDYQIDGLDWLVALDKNDANGILADEMGLGKTLQFISMIAYLLEEGNGKSDHFLVIGPLSTLRNWVDEFKKFAPKIPVILYHGSADAKKAMRDNISCLNKVNNTIKTFPVVITSYETLHHDKYLRSIKWRYLVVDEGQRLKNPNCLLVNILERFNFKNCCLLTGTPVQNNLTELWSLLHFILPSKVPDLDVFLRWFDSSFLWEAEKNENVVLGEENSKSFNTLHKVLKPFILRRIKADVGLNIPLKKEIIVHATMTKWQDRLYSAVVDRTLRKLQGLNKDLDCPNALARAIRINNLKCKSESEAMNDKENQPNEAETLAAKRPRRRYAAKPGDYYLLQKGVPRDTIRMQFKDDQDSSEDLVVDKLLEGLAQPDEEFVTQIKVDNPMQALRMICSHPYTVSYPAIPGTRMLKIDERVVERSGKMQILDAMLQRLKANGHKVLIFSVFTRMLDVIEDYLEIKGYLYTKLDGRCDLTDRQESIQKFTTDDNVFVFLISTRAGGLGINLMAADTVIIVDSDWNPQVDLQAQDRCHRIGQTKPVAVYRLVVKGTIDEHIVDRAETKKQLDRVVIQHGKFKNLDKHESLNMEELLEFLQKSRDVYKFDMGRGLGYTSQELDALCDRATVFNTVKKEDASSS
ncbi:lymphocyte-specific helicase-like [Frankliniella occidentalis]|uniref:Lymphocyte-specific helicase-like n=1 Tax=Frankliniella occidentalis TaxID=133901 RepID=A0A6J1SVV4_FRAOC|nr:lymphocyte-specific helicase-like [Frankliniella occidentalis]